MGGGAATGVARGCQHVRFLLTDPSNTTWKPTLVVTLSCHNPGTCGPPSSDSPAGRSRRRWRGRPALPQRCTTPLPLASWAAWWPPRASKSLVIVKLT